MNKLFALFLTFWSTVFTAIPAEAPVQMATTDPTPTIAGVSVEEKIPDPDLTLPITVSKFNPWFKEFGSFVDDGRFYGYHSGDDIETDADDLKARGIVDVPVYAMADGTVQYVGWVKGYGGVVILKHVINGEAISSLYGHVDVDHSAMVKKGEAVKKGQQIAILGEAFTHETDGRRMHLHFALWKGEDLKFPGYVDTTAELSPWMDPYQFFVDHGLLDPTPLSAALKQME